MAQMIIAVRLLTTSEVAQILEVSETTVRRLGDRDLLQFIPVNGKGVRRYDEDVVMDYMMRRHNEQAALTN